MEKIKLEIEITQLQIDSLMGIGKVRWGSDERQALVRGAEASIANTVLCEYLKKFPVPEDNFICIDGHRIRLSDKLIESLKKELKDTNK